MAKVAMTPEEQLEDLQRRFQLLEGATWIVRKIGGWLMRSRAVRTYMQQRNISRPRKHKWHIFETFWIMNWS